MKIHRADLVVVLVVLGITAGFGLAVLRPGVREVDDRKKEVFAAGQEANELQARMANQAELDASIRSLSRQLRDEDRRLPRHRQFGEFLNALARNLGQAGIEDYTIEPRTPQELDDEKLPESLSLVRETLILPVRVKFKWRVGPTVTFLDALETMPRIAQVNRMEMRAVEETPGTVEVDLFVHAYCRPAS